VSDALRVWRAGPREAGEVARLLVAFRDWLEAQAPSADALHAGVRRLIDEPGTEYLLAAIGDEGPASGVCQLRYRDCIWTSSEDCWIEDLFVAEDARRRGLARALVDAACERARERGAARIELDTSETNAPAIALYESLGFTATSKVHGALTGRDLFMGRRL
jgi:ribosomal protein S18 acetylase RimI-like enzyme